MDKEKEAKGGWLVSNGPAYERLEVPSDSEIILRRFRMLEEEVYGMKKFIIQLQEILIKHNLT